MADDPATAEAEHMDQAAHDKDHENIHGKLDQILGIISGGGRPNSDPSTAESGRPPDLASQVRAELDKARAEAKAEDEQASKEQTLEERLKALEETVPEPPQPRHQRVLWGKR